MVVLLLTSNRFTKTTLCYDSIQGAKRGGGRCESLKDSAFCNIKLSPFLAFHFKDLLSYCEQ